MNVFKLEISEYDNGGFFYYKFINLATELIVDNTIAVGSYIHRADDLFKKDKATYKIYRVFASYCTILDGDTLANVSYDSICKLPIIIPKIKKSKKAIAKIKTIKGDTDGKSRKKKESIPETKTTERIEFPKEKKRPTIKVQANTAKKTFGTINSCFY